jgi:hypothetical protein
MPRSARLIRKTKSPRSARPVVSQANGFAPEYRVGPGRPPKEFQFKPGQSGNPKGARRKATSVGPDLKAILERSLNNKVTLKQGEKQRIISKAAAGIEQLVNQFAMGDRHARRDLIDLARKLNVDLVAGKSQMIEQALEADLSAEDQALLSDYLRRHRDDDPGPAESTNDEPDEEAT